MFGFFFAAGFGFFGGFLVLCFPACLSAFLLFCFCFSASSLLCLSTSLLFCFSVFLLLCFSAFCLAPFPASLLFMLLCFTCFFSFLLLCFPCFSAFPASLLLCFSAFVLLCLSTSTKTIILYYSTFSFLQSCVFAALLPAPLLLCFLSLLPFCWLFFSFALFSPVCIQNETLKTLGEIQRNPEEILIKTPDKKPLHETLNETLKNP